MELDNGTYVQCMSCGLIYAQEVAADYEQINDDSFAAELEEYAAKVEKRKKEHQRFLRRFDSSRKTGNFLELGCNAGAVLVAAREMGWTVYGVDISDSAATFARENFGLTVHTGAVETAGYPDDYFDVIYSNATLEHVQHLMATMKECARILRPGGFFYGNTVNWDSYTREILGKDWLLLDPTHHVHLFTPANVVTLCERAGLQHVKTWTTGARVKANAVGATFKTPWWLNLMKGPLSAMTRIVPKGDSIEFLATKSDAISPDR